jgi:hypothetical protein
VAHHAHLVQAGLAVEQHQVAVLQVALDLVANLQTAVAAAAAAATRSLSYEGSFAVCSCGHLCELL